MVTSDYLPTILEYLAIAYPDPERPLDGISLKNILDGRQDQRQQPVGFRNRERISWVTNRYKLISNDEGKNFELYDLIIDPAETNNLAEQEPEVASIMQKALLKWLDSCRKSDLGSDY